MGRVEGKVAFITGVARGQGRSHAVRLAREGADIIGLDICEDLPVAHSPHATEEDLAETVRLVEGTGRRIVARKADVRFRDQIDNVVAEGLEAFGKIDVVVANAVTIAYTPLLELTEEAFEATLDVNLHGVYNTVKAALPSMVGRGEGGSIILIASGVAYKAVPVVDYSAAKTALIGMMRSLANELAGSWIRVNVIAPGHVLTPVVDNPAYGERVARQVRNGQPFANREEQLATMWEQFKPRHMLPLGWLEPDDISSGVLFLASDESRYVTAEELRVDGGYAER
jgi:(+)-trans-carveol dehydrogenase